MHIWILQSCPWDQVACIQLVPGHHFWEWWTSSCCQMGSDSVRRWRRGGDSSSCYEKYHVQPNKITYFIICCLRSGCGLKVVDYLSTFTEPWGLPGLLFIFLLSFLLLTNIISSEHSLVIFFFFFTLRFGVWCEQESFCFFQWKDYRAWFTHAQFPLGVCVTA